MTPYRFGRNAIIDGLEEWVSERGQAVRLRDELAQPEPPPDGEEEKFLATLLPVDRRHLVRDVFGQDEDLQPDDKSRGAERFRVFRAGLKAALDLALFEEGDVAPIDMYWGCGQPLNQAWIGWNTDRGQRRVSLILFSDVPAMGWSARDFTSLETVPTGADKGLVVVHEVRQQVATLNTLVPRDT